MPDVWERKNGLNSAVNDASLINGISGYSNIEMYLNKLTNE